MLIPVSCPHSLTTFPQELAKCIHGQSVLLQQPKLFLDVVGIVLSSKRLTLGVYQSADNNEFLARKHSASANSGASNYLTRVLDAITLIHEHIHPFETWGKPACPQARKPEGKHASCPGKA